VGGGGWGQSAEGFGPGFHDVAVGPNGAVAVGRDGLDAVAFASRDLEAWRRAPDQAGFGDSAMKSVVAHGDGFVAVGGSYRVGPDPDNRGLQGEMRDWKAASWTSTDGLTWRRSPDDAQLALADMWHVVSDGSRLVAIGAVSGPPCASGMHPPCYGEDGPLIDDRPAIWTSTDGVTWREAKVPATDGLVAPELRDVAATASGFVAVGVAVSGGQDSVVSPMVWRSADGRTWTAADPGATGKGITFRGLASTAHGLVAVGSAGEDVLSSVQAIWASGDGVAWQEVARPAVVDSGELAGVIRADDALVAWTHHDLNIGLSDQEIWTSPAGGAWTRAYSYPYMANVGAWTQMVASGGRLVLVGLDDTGAAAIWVSP
jgi:hypothetical protein